MDTTSNALSRILNVLSAHPDAQEKVRAEILEARGGDAERDDEVRDQRVLRLARPVRHHHAPAV